MNIKKTAKHLSVWIAISLVCQGSILYYIDRFYLKTETSFKIVKVETKAVKKSDVSIKIPSDAENVNSSFDGKFISYCENGVLKTVDTSSGQVKLVEPDKGNKISFYNWVSDRQRLIMAEIPTSGNGNIQLKAYDVTKGIKNNLQDLTWSDVSTSVSDIQISPTTNLIYVKVNRGGGITQIYEADVMQDVKKINVRSSSIGNIEIVRNLDELIYEDTASHKILSTNTDHILEFNGVSNPIILGSDADNNVYIGNCVNGLITNVYYGSPEQATSQWKTINVSSPFDPKDCYISEEGSIYVNDSLKGNVVSLKNNQSTSYKGVLIKMCDQCILSDDENKLVETTYK